MTKAGTEALLKSELAKIAPDIDVAEIDREEDLRDEFDIDSMDFLTLVTALSKELGIDIPERDYGRMGTYTDALEYLGGLAEQ